MIKNRLNHWIEKLQSFGRYSFTLEEARSEFVALSDEAVQATISRLAIKKKIRSVFRGFYIILPPQYAGMGILPPSLFIDDLMNSLHRSYYAGLLSAAGFYGSSHQKPQEFFVVTEFPVLRNTVTAGIKINYLSRNEINNHFLRRLKTDSGYITVSSPALTAIDLVQYNHRIGGLNRASTVLSELTDAFNLNDFSSDLLNYSTVSAIQRLGYILDEVLDLGEIAQKIYHELESSNRKFQHIRLNPAKDVKNSAVNKKWKIIVNMEVNPDI